MPSRRTTTTQNSWENYANRGESWNHSKTSTKTKSVPSARTWGYHLSSCTDTHFQVWSFVYLLFVDLFVFFFLKLYICGFAPDCFFACKILVLIFDIKNFVLVKYQYQVSYLILRILCLQDTNSHTYLILRNFEMHCSVNVSYTPIM